MTERTIEIQLRRAFEPNEIGVLRHNLGEV
jgi:hypothetical protein